ncbi:hypothetical protein FDENT_8768, partial [Fusarium denticulatum]
MQNPPAYNITAVTFPPPSPHVILDCGWPSDLDQGLYPPCAAIIRCTQEVKRYSAEAETSSDDESDESSEENQANRVRYDELRDEILSSTDGNLTPTQVLAKMEELDRVEVDQLRVWRGQWPCSSAGRRSSIVTKTKVKEAKERRESEREPKKTA